MTQSATATMVPCHVCNASFPLGATVAAPMVRHPVAAMIAAQHPGWSIESHICRPDLNRFRAAYAAQVLEQDRGELSSLDREVVESLRAHELLAVDVNRDFAEGLTLGQRLADRVASFGGSWGFIISFGVVLIGWIALNTIGILTRPFDPFPYILLNLVLSCVAALQAPVIMMSQNRLEAKDRLRAENDYRVNLKAELEIRHLHAKIDQMLTHHWERLIEIQQLQLDLLEEMARHRRG